MKKVLLTLTAVAGLAIASQAQEYGFNKGNVIVEGNLGLSTTDNKNSEVKTTEFNFTPKVGYFFTDKIAAGINLHAGVNVEDAYGDDEKEKANTLGVGLFGRYYFLDVVSRYKTYAEVSAGYLKAKTENTTAGTTTGNPAINTF